jgi:hypothetical protein
LAAAGCSWWCERGVRECGGSGRGVGGGEGLGGTASCGTSPQSFRRRRRGGEGGKTGMNLDGGAHERSHGRHRTERKLQSKSERTTGRREGGLGVVSPASSSQGVGAAGYWPSGCNWRAEPRTGLPRSTAAHGATPVTRRPACQSASLPAVRLQLLRRSRCLETTKPMLHAA